MLQRVILVFVMYAISRCLSWRDANFNLSYLFSLVSNSFGERFWIYRILLKNISGQSKFILKGNDYSLRCFHEFCEKIILRCFIFSNICKTRVFWIFILGYIKIPRRLNIFIIRIDFSYPKSVNWPIIFNPRQSCRPVYWQFI